MSKAAFQCKACGAVAPAEHAGENEVPGACAVCGAGVTITVEGKPPVVVKRYDQDNWIVLADLSDAELAKGFKVHGLKKSDVARHKDFKFAKGGEPTVGATINVTAEDGMTSADKGGSK